MGQQNPETQESSQIMKKPIKMPDGRFARPQIRKLELYLRGRKSQRASAERPVTPGREQRHTSSSNLRSNYNHGEFDTDRLSGHEIAILGAGSVGSYLAYFMAVAGLVLHIIDFKKVEPKHLRGRRTIYTSDSLGLFKVEALKRKIESDRSGALVRTYPCNVSQFSASDLKAMFQRCLIVILAIDDPEQIVRVSDLAYAIVELMQVAMHARGRSSHIIISMPGLTPCLRCTLQISSARDIHRLDSEPANSLDIMNLAQYAATFATDIACSKVTGRRITRWDTRKNLIYITNTREELSPVGPGLHYESSQKRPGCSICNNKMPF
jgi:molybdopterin/thiamine biosynthesis adenylyltransferase